MGHSGISTLAKSELYVQIKILIVFKIRPYSIKKENEFLDKILCFCTWVTLSQKKSFKPQFRTD